MYVCILYMGVRDRGGGGQLPFQIRKKEKQSCVKFRSLSSDPLWYLKRIEYAYPTLDPDKS